MDTHAVPRQNRLVCTRFLSLLLLLVTAPLAGQRNVQINLQHDSKKVILQVGDAGPPQEYGPGEAVRIPSRLPVRVSLTNTNSALYSCKVTQEPLAVPELDTLKTFLSGIGTYLPLLARDLAALGGPPIPQLIALDAATTELENTLRNLDSLVNGSTGLKRARRQVVSSLSLMRLSPNTVDPSIPAALREWFRSGERCLGGNCEHLSYPSELLLLFDRVHLMQMGVSRAQARAQAVKNSVDAGSRARLTESLDATALVLAAAKKALDSSQEVLRDAYNLERLAFRTMQASSTVPCDIVEVSWDEGKTLSFNVAPLSGDELAPIATREAFDLKLNVLPRWAIRPSVGLSFLMASGAEYPEFSASETETGFEIEENGSQDARFTYGLTLGLTYAALDHREAANWAVWLPELIVNPLDDVKAVGVGAGISYGIVKLGVGQLFTRHNVLDDQQVGDVIQSAGALRTRETFGQGKWYVSISLMGLPPFIPGS